MKRRSRLQIYIDVLNSIKEGIHKPTRIMQNANLSYSLLQRVLISLEKQGLVKKTEYLLKVRNRDRRTTRVYELTTKGEQVLRYLRNVDSIIQVGSSEMNPYLKLRNSNKNLFFSE